MSWCLYQIPQYDTRYGTVYTYPVLRTALTVCTYQYVWIRIGTEDTYSATVPHVLPYEVQGYSRTEVQYEVLPYTVKLDLILRDFESSIVYHHLHLLSCNGKMGSSAKKKKERKKDFQVCLAIALCKHIFH